MTNRAKMYLKKGEKVKVFVGKDKGKDGEINIVDLSHAVDMIYNIGYKKYQI